MATRYDQFRKIRARYSNQVQLMTRAVSPVVEAAAAPTASVTLTNYTSYSPSRFRGSSRPGYAIP